jgi:hypothetical protein
MATRNETRVPFFGARVLSFHGVFRVIKVRIEFQITRVAAQIAVKRQSLHSIQIGVAGLLRLTSTTRGDFSRGKRNQQ